MKKLIAFVCLMFPVMVACATEPAQPDVALADEPSLEAPAASPSPGAEAPIGTLADEPCLNYCTGGGRTPFMTCVPVCRRDRQVIFPVEPIKLAVLPTCGDNICQLPDELNRDSGRYCLRDCRLTIELTPNRLIINHKIVAEAEGENVLLRSSAFDAGM